MIKYISKKLKTLLVALSYGLKNTEHDILKQKSTSNSSSNASEQKMQANQLAEDLLKGEVTEEVSMLRDRTYMVSEESKKYKVIIDTVGTSKALKKTSKLNTPKIYDNENGYNLKLIMDNFPIPTGVLEGLNSVGGYGIKNKYPLKFEYQNYPPKFKLDEYVRKLVVRTGEKIHLDLYIPKYVDSFERLEKIFDNEINKVRNGNIKPNNLLFDTIEFILNNTYGVDDLIEFKFKMIDFIGIAEYDGKHILMYEVEQVNSNNNKITDKYKNKKLRENYSNKKPRKQTLDLSEKNKQKNTCEHCGIEMESDYDYRISKATVGAGLCKKCLNKYLEKEQAIV